MSFNSSRYEYPYGIHLLDDIHNIFPEFMYDPGMFPTSQQLTFLQTRTRELFPEEFAHNRSQYRLFQMDRRRREAGVPPAVVRRVNTVSVPATPPQLQNTNTNHQGLPLISPYRVFTVPLTSLFTDTTESDAFTNLLTAVLLGDENLANLITPVVVAPTSEQLREASDPIAIDPPSDVTCTICQEHLSPTCTEWRTLLYCHHQFHRTCIDEWFRQNVHCPVCRHDIRETD